MRLLYTLTAYPPSIGGAQIHTHLLAQAIGQKNRVQVMCHWDHNRTDWLLGTTLKQPSAKDYTLDSIPVHRLGYGRLDKLRLLPWLPFYYPLMAVALPPIARRIQQQLSPFAQKADVIHNVRIGREGLSYASLQTARHYDIPFVLTPVHHPRWVGWRYRAYLQLYQQAAAIIALTPSEKKILIELKVAPEKIHVTGIGPVLANTADGNRFRTHYGIDGPMVLFLGQHYPYKGFSQLLQARDQVWAQYSDTRFVFIGPSVQNSEQVFTELADARILRLGTVDLQTKTDALAACDLLCVPSNQESFGGVFTEAWSFKKPVIGGRIPAIQDVITEDTDGYLVGQTSGEIADRIIDLLAQPIKAMAMGEAGYRKVKSRYTWSVLATKTQNVYEAAKL
ncbi:glycosyltransferase family 4 protein [Leptothoe sp. PORK10 BA2]|uniref:glycosyltransferase family 4 protein n=1 Tax=Leptothoe sp. PORK10 BA2 TaxID=3110254 RepID=UPI002B1F7188|nr:glycosyltransferase family 4 protein [Leptothoe sp. PORK10 BA2]MEA5464690.1 glycosyltransferase family 4 protein [Leptothoe sp. PORK10 BA2]